MPVSCLLVPPASVVKLSPPAARKEFTVTAYVDARLIGVPSSHMPVIREPAALVGS